VANHGLVEIIKVAVRDTPKVSIYSFQTQAELAAGVLEEEEQARKNGTTSQRNIAFQDSSHHATVRLFGKSQILLL
jgi:hypothetical protein